MINGIMLQSRASITSLCFMKACFFKSLFSTDFLKTHARMKRRDLPRILPNNMDRKSKVVLKGVVGISAGAAIGFAVSLLSTYAGSG